MNMENTTTNHKRFYALYRRIEVRGDREECRRRLVLQYTGGRTDSLREMTGEEYEDLCRGMEAVLGEREALRKGRSKCLKLMQMLGVDTYDWSCVDRYCCDPRIAGKRFAWLDTDELEALSRKLRAILKKKENATN